MNGPASRITIYIGEGDRLQGKPTHRYILEMLRTEGYPGGTVLRGIEGFGKGSRIHTASILRLSEDLPILIEVVVPEDRRQGLLDALSGLGLRGLITVESVEVYQYGGPKE